MNKTLLTILLLATMLQAGNNESFYYGKNACGEYDLGESWTCSDGCNTCTCEGYGVVFSTLVYCMTEEETDFWNQYYEWSNNETWNDSEFIETQLFRNRIRFPNTTNETYAEVEVPSPTPTWTVVPVEPADFSLPITNSFGCDEKPTSLELITGLFTNLFKELFK